MTSCCCQGGFCELILPTNTLNNLNNNNKQNAASLSKREKRLLKSRERDKAIRILQWVLTTDEYSLLEDSGDLVRLRVVKPKKSKSGSCCKEEEEEGYWMDGNAVNLAKREHRPDLARLAFAEFQSAGDLGDDLEMNDLGSGSSSHVNCGTCSVQNNPSCGPNQITQPSHAGNDDGDLVICGACFQVYNLLEQARELLALQQQQSELDENDVTIIDERGDYFDNNNQPGDNHRHPLDSFEHMEDMPTNKLKRASSEGPNSSEWNMATSTKAKKTILSAASFHGPISPQHLHKRIDGGVDDNGDPTSNGRELQKKKHRKEMEENSKIHILVAESDEVCVWVDFF